MKIKLNIKKVVKPIIVIGCFMFFSLGMRAQDFKNNYDNVNYRGKSNFWGLTDFYTDVNFRRSVNVYSNNNIASIKFLFNNNSDLEIGQSFGGAAYIKTKSNNSIDLGTRGKIYVVISDGGTSFFNEGIFEKTSLFKGIATFNSVTNFKNPINLNTAENNDAYINIKSGSLKDFRLSQDKNSHTYVWNGANGNMVFATNNAERMKIMANGKVGIGHTDPQAMLHVKDNTGSGKVARFEVLSNNVSYGLDIDAWGNGANIDPIRANDNIYVGRDVGLGNFFVQSGNVAIGADVAKNAKLSVNGFTYIGPGDPSDDLRSNYLFAVNGKIKAQEIDLDYQNWPDYVFEQGYKRLAINKLKGFIEENGHLPNVKSAEEVEKNGIGVAESNKVLMEKVEELTLYIIELQEQIDELREKK